MQDIMFVGLDVHKATISVAVAQGARGGEVRSWGTIPNRADHVRKRKCNGVTLCGEALRLVEAPWHEVFDAALRVAVKDGAQGGGEIVDPVNVGHLAGGDQRGEHRPVLGASFVPGEEYTLAIMQNSA
jgi:hypothetical protein